MRCSMSKTTCIKRQKYGIRLHTTNGTTRKGLTPWECQDCEQGAGILREIEENGGKEDMSKKGMCENCGRGPMDLPGKGLCWSCYIAQQHLEGEYQEKALAEAKEKYAGRPIRKINKKEKPARDSEVVAKGTAFGYTPEEITGTPLEKPTPMPAVPEETTADSFAVPESTPPDNEIEAGKPDPVEGGPPATSEKQPIPGQITFLKYDAHPAITLIFSDDGDREIFDWIAREAKQARRDPAQQIMHIIDHVYTPGA